MIRKFRMNGIQWNVVYVHPNNSKLVDRTGRRTVATTDPRIREISIANNIHGEFRRRVLIHELAHCAMVSYGLIEYIHQMVKERYWIAMEEMICNFLADYGMQIFRIASEILGDEAIYIIPGYISNMVA